MEVPFERLLSNPHVSLIMTIDNRKVKKTIQAYFSGRMRSDWTRAILEALIRKTGEAWGDNGFRFYGHRHFQKPFVCDLKVDCRAITEMNIK